MTIKIPGSRIALIFLSVTVLAAAQTGAQTRSSASPGAIVRPNVVIILADDMGWNDVGYHGSDIHTPHIDQLAAEGLELDRFYAQTACSPTRAALLSGQSSQSLGIYSPLSKLNPTGLALDQKIMPAYFRDAGYQTFMVGKWHLGFYEPEYRPLARGFDHFYGNLTGGVGYWNHVHGGGLDWQRNGKTLRQEGYSTHLQSAEITRLIQQRDPEKPLFLYAAFNAPHLPNEAPADTLARYAHIENPNRRIHAAMVTELDSAIGQLMETLSTEGMLENTLIWFMSDNGGLNRTAMPSGLVSMSQRLEDWFGKPLFPKTLEFIRTNALDGGSDNSPHRKGKQSIYEGGARVPSFVYWKGRLSPERITQMVTVKDVLPTLLSATDIDANGLPTATTTESAGVDQWPGLTRGEFIQAPDYLINGMDGEALYRFPWKLLALKSGDLELYNVDEDPGESVNLIARYAELAAELKAALDGSVRGESVHVPLYRSLLDMDFFGGEEDRIPWSEIGGE
ncbi:arylsulfatase B [gamma proteobacterium NOR5-3]|nr:arylsulfatase B [gamma proteobacterium NOR5-3]